MPTFVDLSVCHSIGLSLDKMSKIVKNQDFSLTIENKSYQSCCIELSNISRFIVCLSVSLSAVKCQIRLVKKGFTGI